MKIFKKLFLRIKISSARMTLRIVLRANSGDLIAALQLRMAGVPMPVPSHYIGNLRNKIAKLEFQAGE